MPRTEPRTVPAVTAGRTSALLPEPHAAHAPLPDGSRRPVPVPPVDSAQHHRQQLAAPLGTAPPPWLSRTLRAELAQPPHRPPLAAPSPLRASANALCTPRPRSRYMPPPPRCRAGPSRHYCPCAEHGPVTASSPPPPPRLVYKRHLSLLSTTTKPFRPPPPLPKLWSTVATRAVAELGPLPWPGHLTPPPPEVSRGIDSPRLPLPFASLPGRRLASEHRRPNPLPSAFSRPLFCRREEEERGFSPKPPPSFLLSKEPLHQPSTNRQAQISSQAYEPLAQPD